MTQLNYAMRKALSEGKAILVADHDTLVGVADSYQDAIQKSLDDKFDGLDTISIMGPLDQDGQRIMGDWVAIQDAQQLLVDVTKGLQPDE